MSSVHFRAGSHGLDPFVATSAIPRSSPVDDGVPVRDGANLADYRDKLRKPSDTRVAGVRGKIEEAGHAIRNAIQKATGTSAARGELNEAACTRFEQNFPAMSDDLLIADYHCTLTCRNGEAKCFVTLTNRHVLFVLEDGGPTAVELDDVISILPVSLVRVMPNAVATDNDFTGLEIFLRSKQFFILRRFATRDVLADCIRNVDRAWRNMKQSDSATPIGIDFVSSTEFAQPVLEDAKELKETEPVLISQTVPVEVDLVPCKGDIVHESILTNTALAGPSSSAGG